MNYHWPISVVFIMSSVVYSDFIFSGALGIVLFVVIMKFGSGGGKHPQVKKDDDIVVPDVAENEPSIENSVDMLTKNAKIQKMFNLTDEQMKEAVDATKRDLSKTSPDDEVGWVTIIDKIILLLLVVFVLFAINVLTHGEFGRVLLGFFPQEFESLKLTEYLKKFHIVHNL